MRRIGIIVMAALPFLSACKRDNPPCGDISGTRWTGTNIAKGELVDMVTGPEGVSTLSLSFYRDPEDYSTRGASIDTSGHLIYRMGGTYKAVPVSTDAGDEVTGYYWTFEGTCPDGTVLKGSMTYDNKRMFLRLDGDYYPMNQEM